MSMENKAANASDLAAKNCTPCRGGVPPLPTKELERLRTALPNWKVVDNHQLERSFKFPDFKSALAFTNRVGEIAESQDHHPDIYLSWGRVKVVTWTHAANGLTENDFILAAKIDGLATS
jgi:4a-hydroxytetrahydrobiopterin dehydratase